MSAATFANPVSVDRKPWGRRIEVFSAKLDRRLTLLSRDAHDVWLLLEGDFRVKRFCERPAYVADAQGRLLDFWVTTGRREHFWVIGREDDGDRQWPRRVHDLPLRVMKREELLARRMATTNWGKIVPYLTASRSHRAARLEDDVLHRLEKPYKLGRLEAAFSPLDPQLVRTAAFELMAAGKVVADHFDTAPLGLGTVLRKRAR